MRFSPINDLSRRGAMTLIEILIVVGIIALLLAIVVPSMSRAREEGRSAHCAATLHQAGSGMTMYLDDNEGMFWPYYEDVNAPNPGRRWWFGFEPGGPPTNSFQAHRPLERGTGFLAPYITNGGDDFHCVSFPYEGGKYFPKFDPPAGGYGYNTAALAGFDQTFPQVPKQKAISDFDGRTADVFVLADGIHFDRLSYSGQLEQTFNEPPYIQWQDPDLFSGNIGLNGGFGHFRHNRRANVLYLDGHAAAQPVRRRPHPFSGKGYGPVANLSDDMLRIREIVRGNRTLKVDLIYGLE